MYHGQCLMRITDCSSLLKDPPLRSPVCQLNASPAIIYLFCHPCGPPSDWMCPEHPSIPYDLRDFHRFTLPLGSQVVGKIDRSSKTLSMPSIIRIVHTCLPNLGVSLAITYRHGLLPVKMSGYDLRLTSR